MSFDLNVGRNVAREHPHHHHTHREKRHAHREAGTCRHMQTYRQAHATRAHLHFFGIANRCSKQAHNTKKNKEMMPQHPCDAPLFVGARASARECGDVRVSEGTK